MPVHFRPAVNQPVTQEEGLRTLECQDDRLFPGRGVGSMEQKGAGSCNSDQIESVNDHLHCKKTCSPLLHFLFLQNLLVEVAVVSSLRSF